MRRESKRRLIVSIPTSAYRVLLAQAERDDRAAAQQASYILRRLREGDSPSAELGTTRAASASRPFD
jgi:hypothetical protein